DGFVTASDATNGPLSGGRRGTGEGSPVETLLEFWRRAWNPPYDLTAIEDLLVEDFVLTNAGGREIKPRSAFKDWAVQFQSRINDLRLEEYDTFQNVDGTRVVSRWAVFGKNNGMFGMAPDQRPISFTGISLWEVRDGKLAHNWVERSAWELFQQLRNA